MKSKVMNYGHVVLAVVSCVVSAWAQDNDHIVDITVAKHVDTANDGNAAAKYTAGTTLLKTNDGVCGDEVACCVTLQQSGASGSFGTMGDGLDVITTDAELQAVFAVATHHTKVVTSASGSCHTAGAWKGCTKLGKRNVVMTATAAADSWTHEIGHTKGLVHPPADACDKLIMYPAGTDRKAVTKADCCAFRKNPDQVGPPCNQPDPDSGAQQWKRSMQVMPVIAPVRDAGVYHLATGRWTRGDQHQDLGDKVLYANTANTGFFGVMGVACDIRWSDEGRIPSTDGHSNAKSDSYLIQAIEFAYCSSVVGPQFGGLDFYDSYASCTNPAGLVAVFSAGFAVPGGGTSTSCWIVTFDLKGTSFEFVVHGDSNEVFECSTALDNFGWTLTFLDGGAGGFNGPLLNGDPNNFPYGDGTYFQNSGATYASGLDTQDQFWLADPGGCYANGCYWFGGYPGSNMFASFWLRLSGSNYDEGLGTKYCATTANSTGAPADISGAGTSAAAGDITLISAPVPNQPSIFFHGPNPANVPFGNGVRCVGGQLVRGAVTVASGNSASYTYDNSDNEHSLLGVVGTLRHFQHWFRDPMAGGAAFNLSNGVMFTVN